jgi:hypothetical protein
MKLALTPSGRVVDLPDQAQRLAETYRSKMMDAAELLHLAATLSLYPWDERAIVVEIGAYTGQTTVFMAQVLQLLKKRVPILSIDPFERAQPDPLNPQGVYAAYLENMRKHKVENLCLPLVAFSQYAAAVVPERIGVLIVDGSHHYPIVSQDLALYTIKVLPGGLVFLDDYVPAYPGVMRAADEYLTPERSFRILHKTYFVIAQRME